MRKTKRFNRSTRDVLIFIMVLGAMLLAVVFFTGDLSNIKMESILNGLSRVAR